MKVVKNDNNNPLSPAEMKACQQFEASTQAGQVLFNPQVATGQPAPNCFALFDGVGRLRRHLPGGTVHRRNRPVVPPPGRRCQVAHGQSLGKGLAGRQSGPLGAQSGAGPHHLRHCRGLVPRHGRRRGYPGRSRWPQRAVVLRSG